MEWSEKFTKEDMPLQVDVEEYINTREFKMFHAYVTGTLKLKVKLEYSSCSLEKGWNIKYKKSGKNMAIVYPKQGFFRVLIALKNDKNPTFINECETYVQNVYQNTDALNGSRWLTFDVTDKNILNNIYKFIELKMA